MSESILTRPASVITDFLGLIDTPAAGTYPANIGKYLRVNAGGTAVEYGASANNSNIFDAVVASKDDGNYTIDDASLPAYYHENGVTDGFAAAVAAVIADGGGTILVRRGTYQTDAAVDCTATLMIMGEGVDLTVVEQTNTANGAFFKTTANNCVINDLTLKMAVVPVAGTTMVDDTGNFTKFKNVKVDYSGTGGTLTRIFYGQGNNSSYEDVSILVAGTSTIVTCDMSGSLCVTRGLYVESPSFPLTISSNESSFKGIYLNGKTPAHTGILSISHGNNNTFDNIIIGIDAIGTLTSYISVAFANDININNINLPLVAYDVECIDIDNCERVKISNSEITYNSATLSGLIIDDSNDVNIENVKITQNGSFVPVSILRGLRCTLSRIQVTATTATECVSIVDSNYITFQESYITQNGTGYSIKIRADGTDAEGNVVEKCRVVTASDYGVHISANAGKTIQGTLIQNSWFTGSCVHMDGTIGDVNYSNVNHNYIYASAASTFIYASGAGNAFVDVTKNNVDMRTYANGVGIDVLSGTGVVDNTIYVYANRIYGSGDNQYAIIDRGYAYILHNEVLLFGSSAVGIRTYYRGHIVNNRVNMYTGDNQIGIWCSADYEHIVNSNWVAMTGTASVYLYGVLFNKDASSKVVCTSNFVSISINNANATGFYGDPVGNLTQGVFTSNTCARGGALTLWEQMGTTVLKQDSGAVSLNGFY